MKWILSLAAFMGMSGVMLGAFAAHGLKNKIEPRLLDAFQTGVHYQLWHALAVVLLVLLYKNQPQNLLIWSASSMLAGIVLFSGSLYMLALTGIKWFGPITPIGGVALIVGWLLLIITSVKEVS